MIVDRGTEVDQDLQRQRAQSVLQGLEAALGPIRWRVSPEPFWLTPGEVSFLQDLGNHLLSFYQAFNGLYHQSVRGRLPQWVAHYLDRGKPSDLITYGRMNRLKLQLPGIIRPDLILTEPSVSGLGMVCTELDSVPGGFGNTACLELLYTKMDYSLVGGGDGILDGFSAMIRDVAGQEHPSLAIVVSEESKDYQPEMRWLGKALQQRGFSAYVVEPGEIEFTETGLFTHSPSGGQIRIDIIYRFFELFDLRNIPKAELVLYAAKKGLVALTPPVKPFLEEKMAFALFHHPVLRSFWFEKLGEFTFHLLEQLFPKTWILDPREVPPHAIIPGLVVGDRWITQWKDIGHMGQKERRFVIKPSGFSELAWGSRGVTVGHDVPEQRWQQVIGDALASFEQTPYILQEFYKGRRVEVSYYDTADHSIKTLAGRTRLCPYYFVIGGKAKLGGILATVCPLDKKLLHGMLDAVMVPCGLRQV